MADNESDDALERLLDHALHDLPLRRAPQTLESRVLRELERRAAMPWWRGSFTHWPPPARAAFLLICAALIWLAFRGGATAAAGLGSLTWTREVAMFMTSAGNLAALLARATLPAWAYQAAAVCALLYAILFGLGAVVYRTLYLQPQNAR
jgi:hypothetical protein